MPDEAKLPKWAQDELRRLRSRISNLEIYLAIANEQAPLNGKTGKLIADTLGIRDGFPLSDRAMVSFKASTGWIDCMLRQVGHAEVLDINVRAGRMLIVPCAANCAYVKSE